ncbi:hypothetical protein [Alishewanella maricola]|nr:hypothetical protein [Alishewanella maricola]
MLTAEDFDTISHDITLEQVVTTANDLLQGKVRGRVIVKVAE